MENDLIDRLLETSITNQLVIYDNVGLQSSSKLTEKKLLLIS